MKIGFVKLNKKSGNENPVRQESKRMEMKKPILEDEFNRKRKQTKKSNK